MLQAKLAHFAGTAKEAVVARVESFLSKHYGRRISLQVKGVERTPKSLTDVGSQSASRI